MAATLNSPSGLAIDQNENLFICTGARIRRVSPSGIITTVAGTSWADTVHRYQGDGLAAIDANILPTTLVIDKFGNLYFIDQNSEHYSDVRKIGPEGRITTIAVPNPPFYSMAVDSSGNLYVGGFSSVQKIDRSGNVTLFAGSIASGYGGDGGPAITATLNTIHGLAVDSTGDVVIRLPPDATDYCLSRRLSVRAISLRRIVAILP